MSLPDRLRRETRSEHAAIEAALGLGRDGLTLERYREILERFYGFYLPVERDLLALGSSAGTGLDLSERSKTPLLHADLEALGVVPSAVALCADAPRPRSQAEAFGICYVLEGATLGGQVMSRHLQAALA